MIFDNIKAVAKKRYPWLGICDVRSINFEDNTVDLISKQNGISTLIDITYNDIEFLTYTGITDKNGVKIYLGDLVETPMSKSLNMKPSEVIFKNGAYHLTDSMLSLFDIASASTRVGNIYDNYVLPKNITSKYEYNKG